MCVNSDQRNGLHQFHRHHTIASEDRQASNHHADQLPSSPLAAPLCNSSHQASTLEGLRHNLPSSPVTLCSSSSMQDSDEAPDSNAKQVFFARF